MKSLLVTMAVLISITTAAQSQEAQNSTKELIVAQFCLSNNPIVQLGDSVKYFSRTPKFKPFNGKIKIGDNISTLYSKPNAGQTECRQVVDWRLWRTTLDCISKRHNNEDKLYIPLVEWCEFWIGCENDFFNSMKKYTFVA